MSVQRTAYWRCSDCGYAVTISNRWSRAGVPRCLNAEPQANGAKCINVGKPLTKRAQRPTPAVEAVDTTQQSTDISTPEAPSYKSKRYEILTKLNGMSHEAALKEMEIEADENI